VYFDRLVQREVGGGRGAMVVAGDVQLGDLRGVAEAAVGDDAGDAADHQAGEEDAAGGGGAGVLAAVHHQDGAGGAFLDGAALGLGVVAEDGHRVEVFA